MPTSAEGFGEESNTQESNLAFTKRMYDAAEESLFIASMGYIEQPDENHIDALNEAVADVQSSFTECVDAILSDERLDDDERAGCIQVLMREADSKRVTAMQSQTMSDEFQVANHEKVKSSIMTCLGDLDAVRVVDEDGEVLKEGKEALVHIITDSFAQYFNSDIATFDRVTHEMFVNQAEADSASEDIEVEIDIRRLVSGIGKTVASAAIAGLVAGAVLKRTQK